MRGLNVHSSIYKRRKDKELKYIPIMWFSISRFVKFKAFLGSVLPLYTAMCEFEINKNNKVLLTILEDCLLASCGDF